jgi:hypothetical protein
MGRFGVNDAENYGGNGGSSFFALRNDGDVARVRFMYNNMEDVAGYAVHEVTIDDKKRYVNCLRAYNEPKSKCPFCEANNFQRAKLYIPIYDIDEGEVKVWERGKNFFAKMSALCARYSSAETPLVAHTFEIERHGKKGDTGTQYEIYEVGSDKTRLEDLPEQPNVLGTIILDKSADDMREFLDTGSFNTDSGVSRRESREEQSVRRTPSRRGEAF